MQRMRAVTGLASSLLLLASCVVEVPQEAADGGGGAGAGPGAEHACADGADDDGDGAVDCADPDCADADPCQPPRERCDGEADLDGDGDAGCADADCDLAPCDAAGRVCEGGACTCPSGLDHELDCGDRLDGDCDGLDDCEDPDCSEGCGQGRP